MTKPYEIDLIYIFYNNKKEIFFLAKQIIKFSRKLKNIYVVDNGSLDNTFSILHNYLHAYKNIHIIKLKKNLHYGGAIKKVLPLCRSDSISWMNGDTSISEDFFDNANKYLKNSSGDLLIKGKRKDRKSLDTSITFLLSLYTSIRLKKYFSDVSAFPTIVSSNIKKLIIKNAFDDYTFELSVYYIAHKLNFSILKIPVSYYTASNNNSTWKRNLIGYYKMIKIWNRAITKLVISKYDLR
jgi:GT2 family glycosyltransferase